MDHYCIQTYSCGIQLSSAPSSLMSGSSGLSSEGEFNQINEKINFILPGLAMCWNLEMK